MDDAAETRTANLRAMLVRSLVPEGGTLWIGRDPGYRGARRTGLPLTDEPHMDTMASLFGTTLRKATRGEAVKERTASVVWKMLGLIGRPVCLWNVFPFHPHEADQPMTNRCHTRYERDTALPFLEMLIEFGRPCTVVAIGRDAERAVAELGLGDVVEGVRHPSYGGQAQFMSQIAALYDLPSLPPSQGSLLL